jgi:hypothetical protein
MQVLQLLSGRTGLVVELSRQRILIVILVDHKHNSLTSPTSSG